MPAARVIVTDLSQVGRRTLPPRESVGFARGTSGSRPVQRPVDIAQLRRGPQRIAPKMRARRTATQVKREVVAGEIEAQRVPTTARDSQQTMRMPPKAIRRLPFDDHGL